MAINWAYPYPMPKVSLHTHISALQKMVNKLGQSTDPVECKRLELIIALYTRRYT